MFKDDQTPSDDPHPVNGDGAVNHCNCGDGSLDAGAISGDGVDASSVDPSSLDLDQIPTAALLAAVKDRFSISGLEVLDSAKLVQVASEVEELGRCVDLIRLQTFGEIDARGKVQLLEVNKKRDSGLGIAGWEDLPKQDTQESPALSESQESQEVSVLTQSQQSLDADSSTGASDASGAAFVKPAGPAVSITDLHGCRTITELLQRITGSSAATINRKLKLARAIRAGKSLTGENMPARFSAVNAGLTAGLLSEDAALLIVQKLQGLPSHVDGADIRAAEQSLVAMSAGTMAPNELPPGEEDSIPFTELLKRCVRPAGHADLIKTAADLWVAALDQDGIEPDTRERLESRRYIHIGRERNGLVPLSGRLLPSVAALLGGFITSVTSPRTKAGKPAVVAGQSDSENSNSIDNASNSDSESQSDDGVKKSRVSFKGTTIDTGTDSETADAVLFDERTKGQKDHDALAVLAQILHNSKQAPTLGGAPVTLLIEVKQETLNKHIAGGAGGFGLMHTHDGTVAPISMVDVVHAGCAGNVQHVTRNKNGRIIELGTTARVFNSYQRKAITLRDRGCVIPGCMVQANWCEIHHVTEHSKGGATHIDNGVMLCYYHHRNIDKNGWHIKMITGVPYVKPPKWLRGESKWLKAGRQGEIPDLNRRHE